LTAWYPDLDKDTYGNQKATPVRQCATKLGHVKDKTDCDDSDKAIHPGALEVCDTVDNDCDGDIDDKDGGKSGLTAWYPDLDKDTYGNQKATPARQCATKLGHVKNNKDCDDTSALFRPGKFDFKDSKDNDCDTKIDEDVGSETYTHETDIQSIWNSSCTRCHGSSGGLSLKSSAHGKIVNVGSSVSGMDYIEPGDPSDSYLWHKLNGTQLTVGGSGGRMPKTGSLTSGDIKKIEIWIDQGAVK
jgi:hypothetical protein